MLFSHFECTGNPQTLICKYLKRGGVAYNENSQSLWHYHGLYRMCLLMRGGTINHMKHMGYGICFPRKCFKILTLWGCFWDTRKLVDKIMLHVGKFSLKSGGSPLYKTLHSVSASSVKNSRVQYSTVHCTTCIWL